MNVYLAALNKVGSCTQEYLSQPKVREKSITIEKTGRRNKRSLERDVAPPLQSSTCFLFLGDTACCVSLSAQPYSLSLRRWDSCVLCTDAISPNYWQNKAKQRKQNKTLLSLGSLCLNPNR